MIVHCYIQPAHRLIQATIQRDECAQQSTVRMAIGIPNVTLGSRTMKLLNKSLFTYAIACRQL